MRSGAWALLGLASAAAPRRPLGGPRQRCLGEFTPCPGSGDCVMDYGFCGRCGAGEYLCPSDQKTCVPGAAEYRSCPGLEGTHLDASLDIEARLDYLVAHADLDAKIGQLQNKAPAMPELGIPAYQWLNDDQHGVLRTPAKATAMPNGCALGATWSKETLRRVGEVLGLEARGLHNGFLHAPPEDGYDARQPDCNGCGITLYSPNLNLVRDPRWGRAQETFGEDPHHMARLVVAMVTAAQNNSASSRVADDGYLRVGMCCKHFAVYNVEGGGGTEDRYNFNAEVGARDLWEYYMPAFKACAVEAKAVHVMCSYNALNGVPTCANEGLLTEILRKQWDWDGFVVSDYDAWFFMSNDADDYHSSHYVNHSDDAAAAGINAGLDQEGGGDGAISHMKEAVSKNKTTVAHVDEAFRRLFRARIRLGMLDPPSEVSPNQIYVPALDALVNDTAHLAVAEKAARESICLYKNAPVASDSYGRLALPLDASTFQRAGALAVVGPQANVSGYLFGNYAEQADEGNWGKSVVDAFAARVSTAFVAGCDGEIPVACVEHSSLPNATQISAIAEAVVVVLGLAFNKHCEAPGGSPTIANDYCEREGTDRGVVELPRGQVELVKALRVASGSKPLIGVLIHGGAIALGDEVLAALDAVVDAWQPGMFGAEAIAGAVFGDFSPAGRTAVTWYKSTSQLPPLGHMGLYPNKTAGTHGVTYRYYDSEAAGEVLFPFGFGLSYTTFAYSNLRLPARAHGACDVLELSVDVTNTGSVDSDEVVQAYLSQPDASVPAPQLRLVAFERVSVPAGTTRSVALTLEPQDRAVVADETGPSQAVYAASASQLLEAGRLEIFVGGGLPSYFKGGVRGVVQVQESRPLLECEQVIVV